MGGTLEYGATYGANKVPLIDSFLQETLLVPVPHILPDKPDLLTWHISEGSNQIIIKDAEWLHELALHNTCIEYLIFFYQVIEFDVNDLTLLAKNCSQSLKHVKITSKFSTVDLRDFFNSAVMFKDFLGFRHGAKTEDYTGFEYPPNMKYMWFERHTLKDELGLIVPFAHQLIKLGLLDVKKDDQCFLLEKCPNLESLYISSVHGYNILQLLARICKNLKVIKIYDRKPGLKKLRKGCPNLQTLRIKDSKFSKEKAINYLFNNITSLSQSLKCVNITCEFSTVDFKDFFNSAVMLEAFGGCNNSAMTEDYAGFKYPPNMKCPNLETLCADNIYGNKGLQLLAQFCKNLRRIEIYKKHVSEKGLITLAQGCLQLEEIRIKLKDISEEALVYLGAHLKNLQSFDMTSLGRNKRTDHIPAEGIRALLIGCAELQELIINLDHKRLNPVGMRYIGKYGCELRHLSLNFTGIPRLKKLSKGCPKLRVLKIKDCESIKEEDLSLVLNNITSLRYIYAWNEKYRQYLATTHPDFEQVLL
uniref:coronatine-insensitive protein 1-like n=1 Tax=Erigeron canadensis TaxID=72917 RepID=UPI001CB90198|nr:coronatine-insensitive protein 1-like [Erigeron canadensis]